MNAAIHGNTPRDDGGQLDFHTTADRARTAGQMSLAWSIHAALVAAACLPIAAFSADSTTAADPQQTPPASQAQQQGSSTTLDTITVTGIAGSIERSIETKRDQSAIVDAISAEDVGKFPDNNVAESLQRVTGVEITRDTNGEGQYVSIRGLPADFSLVTWNGMSVSSATTVQPNQSAYQRSRSFDFSLISSDFISSLVVYKSSQADLDEGGIAGNVDVKTVTPFGIGEQKILFSAKTQGDPGADDNHYRPDITGLYSNIFANGILGATFGFDLNKRFIPNQNFDNLGWLSFCVNPTGNSSGYQVCNGGTVHQNYEQIVVQNLPTELDTKTGYVSLQWKPFDSTTATLDGLYARRQQDQTGGVFINVPSAPYGQNVYNGSTSGLVVDQNNVLTTVSTPDNWYVDRSQINNTTDTLKNFSLDVDTSLQDWEFEEKALYSDTQTFNYNLGPQESLAPYFVPGLQTFGGYQFSPGASVPGFIFDPKFNYANPSAWASDELTYAGLNSTEKLTTFQADITRHFDNSPLQSIKFGAKLQNHDVPTDIFDYYHNVLSATAAGVNEPFTTAITQNPAANNILSGYSGPGSRLNNLFFINPYKWLQQYYGGSIQNVINSPYTVNQEPAGYSDVQERDKSAYLMANFKFDGAVPVHGNIGVRYAHTSSTVYYDGFPLSAAVFNPNANVCPHGSACQLVTPPISVVNQTGTYHALLPSLNVIADVRDDMDVRFAVSKTMSRPTLSDLPPNPFIDTSGTTITQGNANLQPFTSVNYDLSYEWYFSKSSVLSLAVYDKQMKNFIQQISSNYNITSVVSPGFTAPFTSFLLTEPVNASTAYVRGFEGDYKQHFDFLPLAWSGFGTDFNVTYARGQQNAFSQAASGNIPAVSEPETPFLGLTKVTYNATLFYEKYGFSGLITLNHRDSYLAQISTTPSGLPVNNNVPFFTYTEARNELDGQASYTFGDHYTVFAEATNMLDKPFVQYNQISGTSTHYAEQWTLNGRRVALGFKVVF